MYIHFGPAQGTRVAKLFYIVSYEQGRSQQVAHNSQNFLLELLSQAVSTLDVEYVVSYDNTHHLPTWRLLFRNKEKACPILKTCSDYYIMYRPYLYVLCCKKNLLDMLQYIRVICLNNVDILLLNIQGKQNGVICGRFVIDLSTGLSVFHIRNKKIQRMKY